MKTPPRFHVWCLSWEEQDGQGHDVVAYDILGEYPSRQRGIIYVPSTTLSDASDAAEAYADYVHDNCDGWESTWPLTFRVRSADGEVADFEVDREYVAEFSAREIKPSKAAQPADPADEKES